MAPILYYTASLDSYGSCSQQQCCLDGEMLQIDKFRKMSPSSPSPLTSTVDRANSVLSWISPKRDPAKRIPSCNWYIFDVRNELAGFQLWPKFVLYLLRAFHFRMNLVTFRFLDSVHLIGSCTLSTIAKRGSFQIPQFLAGSFHSRQDTRFRPKFHSFLENIPDKWIPRRMSSYPW